MFPTPTHLHYRYRFFAGQLGPVPIQGGQSSWLPSYGTVLHIDTQVIMLYLRDFNFAVNERTMYHYIVCGNV